MKLRLRLLTHLLFALCFALILLFVPLIAVHAQAGDPGQPPAKTNVLLLIGEVMGLSTVIFAATAWIKQLGVQGRTLTITAFMVGLVIGVSYRYAMYPMVTFADWFWAAAFGLLSGGLATGAYKGVESATGKNLMQPTKPR